MLRLKFFSTLPRKRAVGRRDEDAVADFECFCEQSEADHGAQKPAAFDEIADAEGLKIHQHYAGCSSRGAL